MATPSPMICTQRSTLKSICLSFAEKHKLAAIGYLVLVVLYPIKDIGWSHVFGKLIQSMKSTGKLQTTKYLFMIMGALFVVGTIINYIDQAIEIRLTTDFESHIRNMLARDIFHMQATNHKEMEIGEVVARATQLPGNIFSFISFYRDLIVPRAVTCLGIIGYFAFTHPIIALILTGILAVVGAVYYFGSNVCSKYSLDREAVYVEILRSMDDMFRNIMSIMNMNKQEEELAALHQKNVTFSEHTIKSINCLLRFQSASGVATLIGIGLCIMYMVRGIKTKTINLGSLVTVVILLSTFLGNTSAVYNSMRYIVLRWNALQESLKIFKTCKQAAPHNGAHAHAHAHAPSPHPRDIPPHGFYLHNVGFVYPNGRQVFRNFNLHIEAGKKTLIVGSIGSGKSTLFNLIMKYQLPTYGTLYFEGTPYTHIPETDVRKKIGYVPQLPMLFNRSIYDNIAYGNATSRAQVMAMFRELGMQGFLDTLPAGLDTSCGKSGSFLSGGQRQIVIIMRVLLQNPRVVLLDEPTSAVDDATKKLVLALLQKVMDGRTVIMITHDPTLMNLADTTVNMNEKLKET